MFVDDPASLKTANVVHEVACNCCETQDSTTPSPATRQQLLAAEMGGLCHRPRSEEAKALADHLLDLTLAYEAMHHPRRQKWREKDLKAFKECLGAFAADLLIHAANCKSGGTLYRGTEKTEFTSTLCSSRHFEKLLTLWSEMGWIEVYPGFRRYGDFDGGKTVEMAKRRRLRATPAFLEIAGNHGIDPPTARRHFAKDHQRSSVIEVKSRSIRDNRGQKQSKRLPAPKGPKLDQLSAQIRDLNSFLEGHRFSLDGVPQFKRTFNNGDDPGFNYDLGGRLYCVSSGADYQNMPKEERLNIRIDGEQCAEVDVSNSFLAIAHWSCGEPFDPSVDLYSVDGVEREVVKRIVVARLASEGWPKRWPKGLRKDYQETTGQTLHKRYKLKTAVETVRRAIPILDEIDQLRNGWAQLQHWESEAILDAIMDIKDNHGVVALPIYDSLLVPCSKIGVTVAALHSSYERRFGFSPNLKVRGIDIAH